MLHSLSQGQKLCAGVCGCMDPRGCTCVFMHVKARGQARVVLQNGTAYHFVWFFVVLIFFFLMESHVGLELTE